MVFEYVIIGVFSGFGQAIGTYFALKYAIDHLDKVGNVKEKIKGIMEAKK